MTAASAQGAEASHWCLRKSEARAEVRFAAADGTRLAGYMLGSRWIGIVLGQQFRADACQWIAYAHELATNGYRVLAVDFRTYGDSARPPYPRSRNLPSDLVGAAKVLRKLGSRRIFLIGASMGGTAAAVAATRIAPPVNGIVALSPPAEFVGMDALAAAVKLQVPALYMAGADEVSEPEDVMASTTRLRPPTRLSSSSRTRSSTASTSYSRRSARVSARSSRPSSRSH